MGEFDFGQFQEIFEYLQKKLSAGGALTPEEKKAYDGLMDIANQKLDLTNTADFNALYKAFNALADGETKKKFEELYGTGLLQDETGTIQFTRPGTMVAAMMRRGLSVRDGPIQAMLSEGMKQFLDTTAKNSFAAMTNSYQAMTPIRAQNIQALTNAGNLGSTAAARVAQVVPSAIGGGRGGGGAEGPGEGEPIQLPVPPAPTTPEQPSFFEKLLLAMSPALAGAGLGLAGKFIDRKPDNDPSKKILGEAYGPDERAPGGSSDMPLKQNDPNYFDKLKDEDVGDPATATTPQTWMTENNPYSIDRAAYQNKAPVPSWLGANDPYEINQGAFSGNQSAYGLDPNQYYGLSNQAWSQMPRDTGSYANYEDYGGWNQPPPQQQEYSYSYQPDYSYQQPNYNYQPDYYDDPYQGYDWSQSYDYGQDYGQSYDYGGGDYNYNDYSWDIPSSNNWYSESY